VPAVRRVEPVPGLVIHRSARAAAARHPCQAPPRTRTEETVLDLSHAAHSFDEALGWVSAACGGRLTTPRRRSTASTWWWWRPTAVRRTRPRAGGATCTGTMPPRPASSRCATTGPASRPSRAPSLPRSARSSPNAAGQDHCARADPPRS
jgi:hypothetical protein